jgi:hypothetical protein
MMKQIATFSSIRTISSELYSEGFKKAGTFHNRTTLTLIEKLSLPDAISATQSNLDSTSAFSLYTILRIIKRILCYSPN